MLSVKTLHIIMNSQQLNTDSGFWVTQNLSTNHSYYTHICR